MRKYMRLDKYLEILHRAEQLKNNTRHSWTSSGRRESVAEHSWRLALMAYFMKDTFENIDINKVILMCLFHDMGEAFTGDIPSFEKTSEDSDREEKIVSEWIGTLPEPYRGELAELFGEMKAQKSEEAKLYKALDKMEAVIQHNEADIRTWLPLEYELQLTYGQRETDFCEAARKLKEYINNDTREKIKKAEAAGYVKEAVSDITDDASAGNDRNTGKMGVIRLVLGACFTNCYIVYHRHTKRCMIIDPADEAGKITECIEKNGLIPSYIVITHGHTDHVLAAADLADQYNVLVAVSRIDAWRLLDEELINARPYVEKPYRPVRPSVLLSEGDEIWLDDIRFSIMILPGHTPGSMALRTENAIFTGDTMLAGGHGKTSLYGGDESAMKESIKRLKELDGNYIIYPGHKETTTLDAERGGCPNIG